MPTRRQSLAAAASLPFALGSVAARETKKKPLRYLQIGTGHAHADKLSVYRESADWELVGLVEEDPALRAAATKNPRYREIPLLSLEGGLATPDLRVVGVETEVRDLLRYARLGLEAGCHLHLDKPAGASLSEYRDLMKLADAKGLVVQMGYMYRFNPAVQLLHRFLREGCLGEVFETHAVMSKVIPAGDRKKLAEFAGGTMFELGCHLIDLTIGVLGKPEGISPFPRRVLDGTDDTLMDNMLAVMEYPKATATIRTTGLEVEGFSRRQFTVCGTMGTVHIQPLDRPSMTLTLSEDHRFEGEERIFRKGTDTIAFEPPYRRYVGDAAELAAIVRGEKDNPWPSGHDLAVQETVLEAAGMGRERGRGVEGA